MCHFRPQKDHSINRVRKIKTHRLVNHFTFLKRKREKVREGKSKMSSKSNNTNNIAIWKKETLTKEFNFKFSNPDSKVENCGSLR